MSKEISFFLAGWFSVAIGFEVAPIYGNIAMVEWAGEEFWFAEIAS